MLRRQLAGRYVAAAICATLVCAVNLGVAGSPEFRKTQTTPDEKTKERKNAAGAPLQRTPRDVWPRSKK